MPRAEKKPEGINKFPKSLTGIYGLDDITAGGLPKGRPTLICGGAGSGKTMLAMAFLEHGARDYNEPGVFMSFEENEKELITNFASLGYDLSDLIQHKKIILDFVSIEKAEIQETGEYDLEGLFVRLGQSIDEIGARRVVLDTVEALFAGLNNDAILRSELRRLFRWLKAKGVTAVITGERGEATLSRHGLEEYVSDCVIVLDNRVVNELSTRRLRIVKYRGSGHGTNEYPFILDTQGITILPVTAMGLTHEAGHEQVSSGIADLDVMLDGKGFYRGSSILITGMAGAGKSSIGAHFVEAGCARGERCLYFASEESPSQILRNMRSIGIDLGKWADKGLLKFHAARASSQGLETHLLAVQRLATEFKPSLVVIDAITDFATMGSTLEVKWMTTRLVDFFKAHGITAIFNSLISNLSAEESGVGVSSTMDCWLHLVNVRDDMESNRALYLIKSRGMAHSNQIREFRITSKGIKLLDLYIGPAGAVMGSARLAQEARDRAAITELGQEVERKQGEIEARRKAFEAKLISLKAEFDGEEAEMKKVLDQDKLKLKTLMQNGDAMAHKRHAIGAEAAK